MNYLFNGIFFSRHFCNFGYRLDVVLQVHVQTLAECQRLFRDDLEPEIIRQFLPVAHAHTWIPETLDKGYVGFELFNLLFEVLGHALYS